jgi:hypothetical protein
MSEEISNHAGGKTVAVGSVSEISNLKRREIQAPLLAGVLAGFISEIGYERAMKVTSAGIQNDATAAGKRMAEKYGGNTVQDLHRLVREVWAEDAALEFSVLEVTDLKLIFNVTRCLYAELYDRLGVKEFGFCLSCNRDAAFIKGFNPRLKLVRTRTIMEGADICDFRIVTE